jgi:DNA-directed RNA polymerase alpha subunit/DNA-directed RNA polymerase subunit L
MTDAVFQNLQKPSDRSLTFTMSPVSVSYANTLRRAIQTEVPILGIRADMTEEGTTSDVKIYKNTTPMSNEMLADRVGLLPIAMSPNGDDDAWEKDSVLFRLAVTNDTEEVRIVTASDFECLAKSATSDERVRIPNTRFFKPDPVSQETAIIAILKPLTPGQKPEEIYLEAYATLGRGREHTRFNPTSQCSYGYTRDDDKNRIADLWKNWLITQKKVDVTELQKDESRKAMLEREFRSLEIYRCYKVDGEGEPYSYDFTVESVGAMRVETMVLKGLLAMAALADKYASIDRGDLPDTLDIRPADTRMKGYDFWFSGEDHTLGNILQTWLTDTKVGRPVEDGGMDFVGYKVPHPLRDEMLLRIGVDDASKKFDEGAARLAVAEAAKACSDMFRGWAASWSSFVGDAGLTPPTAPAQGVVAKEVATPWEAHAAAKTKARTS